MGTLGAKTVDKILFMSIPEKVDILFLLLEVELHLFHAGSLVGGQIGQSFLRVLVLLNDTEISALNGLKTLLTDGDTVTLVPISHGG